MYDDSDNWTSLEISYTQSDLVWEIQTSLIRMQRNLVNVVSF